MGKVDRFRNTVEPFAALFWALGIVLGHSWSTSQRRRIAPFSFPIYVGVLFIYVCYPLNNKICFYVGNVSH